MTSPAPCEALLAGVGRPLTCVATGPHRTHTYESTSVMDGRHDDVTGDGLHQKPCLHCGHPNPGCWCPGCGWQL